MFPENRKHVRNFSQTRWEFIGQIVNHMHTRLNTSFYGLRISLLKYLCLK